MNGHVVYGQALFDAGRYDDAETTFATALGLDPENLIALRHLGDIARLTNQAESALGWYQRVLEADPRNEEILTFITELKAAAPAPPPAPEPATPTPAAAQPAVASDSPTIEMAPVKRPVDAAATPIAPVETVPVKRPSVPLLDVDIDFGSGMDDPAAAEPAAAEPAASEASAAEFATSDFTDAGATADAEPAQELQIESALGWDMGGNIDLDTPATESASDATIDGSPDADGAATPQVFVTETMAELYLQQGFRDEALQVYKQLAELNPDDESIRERIRSLESGGRSSMSFERVSDAEPVLAPGTDSLIPMDDLVSTSLAPEAPAEIEPALADLPAIDDSMPEMIDADLAPVEDAAEPVREFEVEPAAVQQVEAAPAAAPEPTKPAAAEPRRATPRATPAGGGATARGFFAALAQRKPLRRDGTAPAGTPVVATPEPAPARRVSGSVDALFGTATQSPDDTMAEALATAVGEVDSSPAIRGKPTQQAQSDLSLDSVFRGDAVMRTSGPVARPSAMLKFDQFFETGAGEPAPSQPDAPPAAPRGEGAAPAAGPSADDAQFQSWLEGLQGKDK